MGTVRPEPRDPGQVLEVVERIASSQVLHESESLCRILRFLVRQSIEEPGRAIKEFDIATRLLGRGSDFDPRIDPAVRVQIGRLRSKLVEYYATEGREDPLIIEIPKGSYNVQIHPRGVKPIATIPVPPPPPEESTGPIPVSPARWKKPLFQLLAIGAAIVAGCLITVLVQRHRPASVLRTFWKPLVSADAPPLVVFSNAPFVGRPETGLRYFDGARDNGVPVLDHYTGIGEVFAIHELDRLFTSLGSSFILKRGQLLTWDDTKGRGVIFIGSPSENLKLLDLPWEKEFAFRRRLEGSMQVLIIENFHPGPGEARFYESPPTIPVKDDYAIATSIPGLDNTRHILLLAGLTTLGTEAAVEFVDDPERIDRLARALKQPIPLHFAAVLHVKVNGGVPSSTEVVAARAFPR